MEAANVPGPGGVPSLQESKHTADYSHDRCYMLQIMKNSLSFMDGEKGIQIWRGRKKKGGRGRCC